MNAKLNTVEWFNFHEIWKVARKKDKEKDLQATNNDIEHSAERVTTIGNILMSNNASEPNE